MEKQYRILRLVATLYKILAWIVLVGGIITALGVIVFGAIGGSAMSQSPLFEGMPAGLSGMVSGLVGGIFAGILIVLAAVIYFVLLYAGAEVIYVGLAIEQNTRETAYYLRGEATLPPPPAQ